MNTYLAPIVVNSLFL